jgi:hypothetical protein
MYKTLCRRQQVITSTLMTRGLETRNIDLGCLLVFRNDFAQPVPMEMVVFAIHMAKANKQMQQDDYRAIIHHVNVLRDPRFLLGVHLCCRLFVFDGKPFPESWMHSSSWYALTAGPRLPVICPEIKLLKKGRTEFSFTLCCVLQARR